MITHVRGATRSPRTRNPTSAVTYGPVDMRINVLATDVCASEKMKHVEAMAMHAATARTGRPPSRHCAKMLRRPAVHNTRLGNNDANRLRHRLVVHGLVVTSLAMSPPLLQHTAAHPTSRAPRRAAGMGESRRVATESGAAVIGMAQRAPMLSGRGGTARLAQAPKSAGQVSTRRPCHVGPSRTNFHSGFWATSRRAAQTAWKVGTSASAHSKYVTKS